MNLEIVSATQRKALIHIDKKKVNELAEVKLKALAPKIKIEGFRPGKAPTALVKNAYWNEVYEDVLNEELRNHISTLIKELEEERMIGTPQANLLKDENNELIFSIEFEVLPEITLTDLSTKKIQRYTCEITKDDIDRTIENLAQHHGGYERRNKDEVATEKDKVLIDFKGTLDGIAFEGGTAQNYPFILGQKTMLPDFENAVYGMKEDETKTVPVNFPENYGKEDLRGKTASFDITLKEIHKNVPKQLDEDFLKNKLELKEGTQEELENLISKTLKIDAKNRIYSKVKEDVLQVLKESNQIDIPSTLINEEIEELVKNAKHYLKQQNVNTENFPIDPEMFRENATNMVALRLLIQKFIKEHHIEINDEEIEEFLKDEAEGYEDPSLYVQFTLANKNKKEEAKLKALEKKTIDHILSLLEVEEVPITYLELLKVTHQ